MLDFIIVKFAFVWAS